VRPPLADVSETDDACQVHIELHGIGRDWIDVQLVDGELIVTGEIIEEEDGGRRRPGVSIRSAAGKS
jgi:HSP20 family molecular chaperone IbpA